MTTLTIQTTNFSYPIIIEQSFANLRHQFQKHITSRKVLIITDSNVEKLYLQKVKSILSNCNIQVYEHTIPAGEASKNLDTITQIYEKCLQCGLDRHSCITALGGGVVGDIAGFAAATFMRGIKFIQIPTTLLAQVDSSIGGKTGVDFNGYKNIVGAFYQPSLVYINASALNTLPKREFISGMAEVIKYGIIADAEFFEFLDKNYKEILNMEPEFVEKIIHRCCQIKADIVSKDEKESGIRAILNFGHTIGHAVESASNFELLHGECVGIAMIAATRISVEMGLLEENEMTRIVEVIRKYGLDVEARADVGEVMENIRKDKKAMNGSIKMILLNGIGNTKIVEVENLSLIKLQ